MAVMPPAVVSGNRLAGMVAVTVRMVISAVFLAVMDMPSRFLTAFYGADRAARINSLCAPVMTVGRYRHNKKNRYHGCGHCRCKKSFQPHNTFLLSQSSFCQLI